MAEPPGGRGLLAWSLAACHAALLLTGLIALLYRTGGLGQLLASLNTAVGLGLYSLLWLCTWWTTRRALAGLPWSALSRPSQLLARFGRIALWGGVNGGLFFLAIAVVIITRLIAASLFSAGVSGDALPGLLFGGLAGTVLAFALGAVVAVLFVLLDAALLAAARWLVPEPTS